MLQGYLYQLPHIYSLLVDMHKIGKLYQKEPTGNVAYTKMGQNLLPENTQPGCGILIRAVNLICSQITEEEDKGARTCDSEWSD
jgi:hypothetical protein